MEERDVWHFHEELAEILGVSVAYVSVALRGAPVYPRILEHVFWRPESELEEFISSNTPFVVAGNPMTRRAVNSVSHDNIGGIYAAVNHLLELGHTRIGYIRLMSGAIGDERYETYVNTLSKKGLSPVCCWDYSDEYNVMNPPKLSVIRKSFGNNAYPGTAVICDSDLTAIVFMRVMREHGLVPGLDISIVGYDDLEVAALMEPPLTSVRTFESELGSSTADLLISCIEQPGIMYRHIHIGTELRVRASTAPPPER